MSPLDILPLLFVLWFSIRYLQSNNVLQDEKLCGLKLEKYNFKMITSIWDQLASEYIQAIIVFPMQKDRIEIHDDIQLAYKDLQSTCVTKDISSDNNQLFQLQYYNNQSRQFFGYNVIRRLDSYMYTPNLALLLDFFDSSCNNVIEYILTDFTWRWFVMDAWILFINVLLCGFLHILLKKNVNEHSF